MSKAGNGAPTHGVERQFKEMGDRGTLEMALVSDDCGFCWNAAGNHFDPGILAALPSVLGDAVRSGRLRLRYFSGEKAGFDIDGADVNSLLQEAGLSATQIQTPTDGYPMWLLSVNHAASGGPLEFTLTAEGSRAVIRPLDAMGCNLFLVGVYSDHAQKGAAGVDPTDLSRQIERVLQAIEHPSQSTDQLPKAEQVAAVLNGLREADPGIRVSALHMDDGLVVASASGVGEEADSLAAIAAGIFHSCRLVGADILGDFPERICFVGEGGTLMGAAVRSDLLLTVLLEPDAGIGMAEMLLRRAVEQMACVVAPQTVTKSQEV